MPQSEAAGRGGLVVALVTAGVNASLSGRTQGALVVPIGISPRTGGRGQGGESRMEATRTKSGAGFTQSWRELAHTPTHQVPVLLGAVVALLVGILTYVFDASKAGAIVAASINQAYLVIFGVIGLIGYAVSKQNVQNGSIVAAIAGLAMVVLVATQLGLFAGLLLLAGAVWSLASPR